MHCQGVGCTPWRPLGSASFECQAWDNVHFAWQVWDNVHCQGVGCTPWRPLGSALLRGRRGGQCALPRGRMYALASLGLRLFCVAGMGQSALPRGRMYALASLGLRLLYAAGVGQCAFCVAGVGQCALPRVRMYALASLGTHSLTLPCSLSLTHTHSVTYSLTH